MKIPLIPFPATTCNTEVEMIIFSTTILGLFSAMYKLENDESNHKPLIMPISVLIAAEVTYNGVAVLVTCAVPVPATVVIIEVAASTFRITT